MGLLGWFCTCCASTSFSKSSKRHEIWKHKSYYGTKYLAFYEDFPQRQAWPLAYRALSHIYNSALFASDYQPINTFGSLPDLLQCSQVGRSREHRNFAFRHPLQERKSALEAVIWASALSWVSPGASFGEIFDIFLRHSHTLFGNECVRKVGQIAEEDNPMSGNIHPKPERFICGILISRIGICVFPK